MRKTAGITQEELADKLDTKQSSISRLESGMENVTSARLQEIVTALNGEIEIRIKHKNREEINQ